MTDTFENDVRTTLARIETKLDYHKDILADHEIRIRRAEGIYQDASGKSKAYAAIMGFVAGTIPLALKLAWDWLTKPHT